MNEPQATDVSNEWSELSEALMRGLVHALNNRITVMSAYIQVLEMGDQDMAPQDVLPTQLSRLEETIVSLRTLSAEQRPAEAIELLPVIDEAIALHAHHPGPRDIRCVLEVNPPNLVPLRVPRWALARLILVLVDHAKRASQLAGHSSFTLEVSGDDQHLSLRLRTGGEGSAYARSLASLCGGTLDVVAGHAIVTMPTLLEARAGARVSVRT